MTTSTLTIEESREGLVVVAKPQRSIMYGLVAGLSSGLFCIIAFRTVLAIPFWVMFALLAAGTSFLLAVRPRGAELRITRLDMHLKGRVGDSLRSTRSVRCEDVRWLEYQTDTTGPETVRHPGGLYAVLKHHSVCVLPEIDQEQATVVIERICKKFPDLNQKWKGQSPLEGHFLSLGLGASRSK